MNISDTGHGHVYPRKDGLRARCGGPALCPQCAKDAVRKATEAAQAAADKEAK